MRSWLLIRTVICSSDSGTYRIVLWVVTEQLIRSGLNRRKDYLNKVYKNSVAIHVVPLGRCVHISINKTNMTFMLNHYCDVSPCHPLRMSKDRVL